MEKMNPDWERNAAAVESTQGLSWFMASFFIIGVVGNSALIILSMLVFAGWGTLFLLILCGFNALYAAICLGRCWSILEERYDEYKTETRRPYSEIANRALGKNMKYFTSVCLNISLAGLSVVYLLLPSTLIALAASSSGLKIIYWTLILAAVLCPLMWLRSPKVFWPAAVVAAICAVLEFLLMIIAISTNRFEMKPIDLSLIRSAYTFFTAFAGICFTFAGIASFPAIQNDMKNKEEFPKAAIVGFSVALVPYLLLAIVGYKIGGDSLAMNIMVSLAFSGFGIYVLIFVSVHMLMAFLVTTNAVCQEFEEIFEVPKEFGWKRVAVRVGVLVLIVLAATVIPSFQEGMSVLEGTTIALIASVFPCLFYYLLCQQQPSGQQWPARTIPIHEKMYIVVVVVCGVVAGIMQTYNAFYFLINKPSTAITNIYM